MGHKTLIGGTAYEVSGGRTLVNGVGYSIDKGKSLVDGTVSEIAFTRTRKVTITGTPNAYTNVQIEEVAYNGDDATLEVKPGTEVICRALLLSGMQSTIKLNGVVVASGTGPQDYTYTVGDRDIVISLGMGAVDIAEK